MIFGLSMRMPVFLSLFLQDNEHTELLFFQNPYANFAHILQHYHDFQSNFTIFPSVVQAYTQPYSFGRRIQLIICQIRRELSVIIHEISTSWMKKTLDGGPNSLMYILCVSVAFVLSFLILNERFHWRNNRYVYKTIPYVDSWHRRGLVGSVLAY